MSQVMLEDANSQLARLMEQASRGEEIIIVRDSTPSPRSSRCRRRSLSRISAMPLAHTVRVSALPFHHRDPFDRMLVAQSLAEGIPLASADQALDAYSVVRLWELTQVATYKRLLDGPLAINQFQRAFLLLETCR